MPTRQIEKSCLYCGGKWGKVGEKGTKKREFSVYPYNNPQLIFNHKDTKFTKKIFAFFAPVW